MSIKNLYLINILFILVSKISSDSDWKTPWNIIVWPVVNLYGNCYISFMNNNINTITSVPSFSYSINNVNFIPSSCSVSSSSNLINCTISDVQNLSLSSSYPNKLYVKFDSNSAQEIIIYPFTYTFTKSSSVYYMDKIRINMDNTVSAVSPYLYINGATLTSESNLRFYSTISLTSYKISDSNIFSITCSSCQGIYGDTTIYKMNSFPNNISDISYTSSLIYLIAGKDVTYPLNLKFQTSFFKNLDIYKCYLRSSVEEDKYIELNCNKYFSDNNRNSLGCSLDIPNTWNVSQKSYVHCEQGINSEILDGNINLDIFATVSSLSTNHVQIVNTNRTEILPRKTRIVLTYSGYVYKGISSINLIDADENEYIVETFKYYVSDHHKVEILFNGYETPIPAGTYYIETRFTSNTDIKIYSNSLPITFYIPIEFYKDHTFIESTSLTSLSIPLMFSDSKVSQIKSISYTINGNSQTVPVNKCSISSNVLSLTGLSITINSGSYAKFTFTMNDDSTQTYVVYSSSKYIDFSFDFNSPCSPDFDCNMTITAGENSKDVSISDITTIKGKLKDQLGETEKTYTSSDNKNFENNGTAILFKLFLQKHQSFIITSISSNSFTFDFTPLDTKYVLYYMDIDQKIYVIDRSIDDIKIDMNFTYSYLAIKNQYNILCGSDPSDNLCTDFTVSNNYISFYYLINQYTSKDITISFFTGSKQNLKISILNSYYNTNNTVCMLYNSESFISASDTFYFYVSLTSNILSDTFNIKIELNENDFIYIKESRLNYLAVFSLSRSNILSHALSIGNLPVYFIEKGNYNQNIKTPKGIDVIQYVLVQQYSYDYLPILSTSSTIYIRSLLHLYYKSVFMMYVKSNSRTTCKTLEDSCTLSTKNYVKDNDIYPIKIDYCGNYVKDSSYIRIIDGNTVAVNLEKNYIALDSLSNGDITLKVFLYGFDSSNYNSMKLYLFNTTKTNIYFNLYDIGENYYEFTIPKSTSLTMGRYKILLTGIKYDDNSKTEVNLNYNYMPYFYVITFNTITASTSDTTTIYRNKNPNKLNLTLNQELPEGFINYVHYTVDDVNKGIILNSFVSHTGTSYTIDVSKISFHLTGSYKFYFETKNSNYTNSINNINDNKIVYNLIVKNQFVLNTKYVFVQEQISIPVSFEMTFEDDNTEINSTAVKYSTERISSQTNITCTVSSESSKKLSCNFEVNNIASRGIRYNISHTDKNEVKSYSLLYVIYYTITEQCQEFSAIKNYKDYLYQFYIKSNDLYWKIYEGGDERKISLSGSYLVAYLYSRDEYTTNYLITIEDLEENKNYSLGELYNKQIKFREDENGIKEIRSLDGQIIDLKAEEKIYELVTLATYKIDNENQSDAISPSKIDQFQGTEEGKLLNFTFDLASHEFSDEVGTKLTYYFYRNKCGSFEKVENITVIITIMDNPRFEGSREHFVLVSNSTANSGYNPQTFVAKITNNKLPSAYPLLYLYYADADTSSKVTENVTITNYDDAEFSYYISIDKPGYYAFYYFFTTETSSEWVITKQIKMYAVTNLNELAILNPLTFDSCRYYKIPFTVDYYILTTIDYPLNGTKVGIYLVEGSDRTNLLEYTSNQYYFTNYLTYFNKTLTLYFVENNDFEQPLFSQEILFTDILLYRTVGLVSKFQYSVMDNCVINSEFFTFVNKANYGTFTISCTYEEEEDNVCYMTSSYDINQYNIYYNGFLLPTRSVEECNYEAVHDYNSYCVLIQEAIGIAANDFNCEDYCKNGATCQQFGDLPVCTCAEGYIGTFCQIPLDNAENIITTSLNKLIADEDFNINDIDEVGEIFAMNKILKYDFENYTDLISENYDKIIEKCEYYYDKYLTNYNTDGTKISRRISAVITDLLSLKYYIDIKLNKISIDIGSNNNDDSSEEEIPLNKNKLRRNTISSLDEFAEEYFEKLKNIQLITDYDRDNLNKSSCGVFYDSFNLAGTSLFFNNLDSIKNCRLQAIGIKGGYANVTSCRGSKNGEGVGEDLDDTKLYISSYFGEDFLTSNGYKNYLYVDAYGTVRKSTTWYANCNFMDVVFKTFDRYYKEADIHSYFLTRGINIFDINDDAFHENCYRAKNFIFDLPQRYRKEIIYQQYTFNDKCYMTDMNSTISDYACKFNNNYMEYQLEETGKITTKNKNLPLTCISKVKEIYKNIAFYVFFILFIVYIVFIVLIYKKFIKKKTLNVHYRPKDEKNRFNTEMISLDYDSERVKIFKRNILIQDIPVTYWQIFILNLYYYHPITACLNNDVINTSYNSFGILMFNIVNFLGWGAIFFTENKMEKRIFKNKRYNMAYPLINEFLRILLTLAVSILCTLIIRLIILVTYGQRNKYVDDYMLVPTNQKKYEFSVKFEKNVLIRRCIAGFIILFFFVFFWFYCVVFCGVYIHSQFGWFFSWIWLLILVWIILVPLYILLISLFEKIFGNNACVYYMKQLFLF